MSTTAQMPRRTASGSPLAPRKRPMLSEIMNKGVGLPNRYVLHATEGFGKTSFAAHAPKPIFIQTKGETGLTTLIDSGQLKPTDSFPETENWLDLTGIIETLTVDDHQYRTLVIDTLNGAERLCHEHVCTRDFGGIWTDRGFASYGKGPEVALTDWRLFLAALDTLRSTRKMTIFCLCHTKVATFRSPDSIDYDRYQPDMHKSTWSLTAKWTDFIGFGNFETTVSGSSDPSKKGKASGGQQRIMYTERHAAYDAKNRLGLPEEIEMGTSAAQGWKNFIEAIKVAKAAPVITATAEPVTEGATN